MSLKLTDEMRAALHSGSNQPVTVEDEQTHRQYVLLPWEVYERARSVFEEPEFATEDAYAAQSAAAGAAGWDDPEMDIYDKYDEIQRQP